jgi:uncharacterized protein GlcG (DUF336 family)
MAVNALDGIGSERDVERMRRRYRKGIMTHQGLVCRIAVVLTIFGAASTAPLRADGLITTHRLSSQMASEAAVEVVASCAKQGYAETAVVVDADGVRQAVLRGDGTGSHSLDSAYDKAYTAATFKNDTLALIERAKTAPGFSGLFAQLPHLILVGGGVPIKLGDELIGAIGAAGAPGGNLDDACAKAGLDRIREWLK